MCGSPQKKRGGQNDPPMPSRVNYCGRDSRIKTVSSHQKSELNFTLSVQVVLLNSPNLSPYFSLNNFERISLLILISSFLCSIKPHFLITKYLNLFVLWKEKLGFDNWLKSPWSLWLPLEGHQSITWLAPIQMLVLIKPIYSSAWFFKGGLNLTMDYARISAAIACLRKRLWCL